MPTTTAELALAIASARRVAGLPSSATVIRPGDAMAPGMNME
ncbi:MAG: hypothetical protein R3D98_05105 [Candidatus Krumholzibacteriia bacterium]